MSGDVCDGLELVRRPYNGPGITKRAVRRPFRGRCPDGLFVTETVTATQVSLLYRSPSFVLATSMAGTAIDIESRAGGASKRPQRSLATVFSETTQCATSTGSRP